MQRLIVRNFKEKRELFRNIHGHLNVGKGKTKLDRKFRAKKDEALNARLKN